MNASLIEKELGFDKQFYVGLFNPLEDASLEALIELMPFLEDPEAGGSQTLSFADDVSLTIFCSYLGRGEEKKLLDLARSRVIKITNIFWLISLTCFQEARIRSISAQAMMEIESYLPEEVSRITHFFRNLSEEESLSVYVFLKESHTQRKDKYLSKLKKYPIRIR